MLKKFVCLAKSFREGGYCVAGKELLSDGRIGGWFRPVDRFADALAVQACGFSLGDIVSCSVMRPVPEPMQPENFLLDRDPCLRAEGVFPFDQVHRLLDSPQTLWETEGSSSSLHGLHDRIAASAAAGVKNSLCFVRIAEGTLTKAEERYGEKQILKMRLAFAYNGVQYSLAVTDPELSGNCRNRQQAGEPEKIGPACLTISLTKPYHGFCYKLVAGYVPL